VFVGEGVRRVKGAPLDVGVRRLATVANAEGVVVKRVPNPRPLDTALRELRHVARARSRCAKGSRQ
jgi:putative transposase